MQGGLPCGGQHRSPVVPPSFHIRRIGAVPLLTLAQEIEKLPVTEPKKVGGIESNAFVVAVVAKTNRRSALEGSRRNPAPGIGAAIHRKRNQRRIRIALLDNLREIVVRNFLQRQPFGVDRAEEVILVVP